MDSEEINKRALTAVEYVLGLRIAQPEYYEAYRGKIESLVREAEKRTEQEVLTEILKQLNERPGQQSSFTSLWLINQIETRLKVLTA